MSVRIKTPLLITAILLFNFVALVGYILLFLPERIVLLVQRITGIHISVESLFNNQFFVSILLFEGAVFVLFALLSAFLVYWFHARPLIKLNSLVSDPKKLGKIAKTIRRDEIGQLQNSFVALSAQLQQEKWNQDRMIAGISHDIKTPLTSIAGYSETLLKKELGMEQARQYLNVIFANAQRIAQIVEEFDLYVEGRLPFTLEQKEFTVLFLEGMLREEYEDELHSRKIRFAVYNTCPPETTFYCDLLKIRRVFANVISNALKHNKEASDFFIEIELGLSDGTLTISVRDNGRGVSNQDLPHLFDPFYTSDADRTRHGLGLSICKDIIEAHSGWIEANNRPYGGFEIRFTLRTQQPSVII